MCYDIQQMGDKIRRQATRQLGITSVDFSQMEFNYFHVSGFSHPMVLAVKSDHPTQLAPVRWGLIPFWVKSPEEAERIGRQTLNARNDGVLVKPSFRQAIRKRRCLIPINGFYENRDIRGKKFPYFVHPVDDDIFWLGGIWESWTNRETGEIIETCSIITTDANPLMQKIHNVKLRMPLIIPDSSILRWLDQSLSEEEILALMEPYPASQMQAYTVSRLVNRKKEETNIPEVAMPFRYPELELIDKA